MNLKCVIIRIVPWEPVGALSSHLELLDSNSFNMELIEIYLPRNLDNASLTVDPHPKNLC